jgi:FMN phosphatase YigB (HAD superfamily)
MKLTTVLLDAGGVILDESEDEQSRVRVAVEVLGGAVPGYSAQMLYGDLDEAIHRYCPRILAYAIWKHTAPDRTLYEKLYADFRSKWRPHRPPLRIMPGFREEAGAMVRKFNLGIAGQYGSDLLDLLERESLIDLFTYRFTQDDFDITKPDPRYLEQITRVCGVDPGECVMVGDRMDNDIIPARQLGMKAILVRVGLHRKQQPRTPSEIPDAEIEGIQGLAEAVLRVSRQEEA